MVYSSFRSTVMSWSRISEPLTHSSVDKSAKQTRYVPGKFCRIPNRSQKRYNTNSQLTSLFWLKMWRVTAFFLACLQLPGKSDVFFLRRALKVLAWPFSPKFAWEYFEKAGIRRHEIVIDQASAVHSHLNSRKIRLQKVKVLQIDELTSASRARNWTNVSRKSSGLSRLIASHSTVVYLLSTGNCHDVHSASISSKLIMRLLCVRSMKATRNVEAGFVGVARRPCAVW